MSVLGPVHRAGHRMFATAVGWADDMRGAYTGLGMAADSSFWVIAEEMRELRAICKRLHVPLLPVWYQMHAQKQCLFFGSHLHLLLDERWFERRNRYGTAYFHGRPGEGVEDFDRAYEMLCKHHPQIFGVQVSHSAMRDVVLSSGIAEDRVVTIPIGINTEMFPLRTDENRRSVREQLGIPQSAVVVGSFQKDGNGWGEGNEPKRVKGPDVLVDTLARLKERVPELLVLLTGPSRGYVKRRLSDLGIPFVHHYFDEYAEISRMFQALDLYIISSREEGGPKAVLEAMATGVPLVTTRVGQAMDLLRHGENGWMVDVEDVEGLAYWAEQALMSADLAPILRQGRATAEANAYDRQDALWAQLFSGFVEGY